MLVMARAMLVEVELLLGPWSFEDSLGYNTANVRGNHPVNNSATG
jgi:hypothetical protein